MRFLNWLQSREGGVWTSADTAHAANHLAEVERLALRVIERMRKERS